MALRGGSGSGRLHSSRRAKLELPSAALESASESATGQRLSASDKEKPHSRQKEERGRSHELLPLENSRIKSESFAYKHLGHAPPRLRERQRLSANCSFRPGKGRKPRTESLDAPKGPKRRARSCVT